jgi:hypothetical protein
MKVSEKPNQVLRNLEGKMNDTFSLYTRKSKLHYSVKNIYRILEKYSACV